MNMVVLYSTGCPKCDVLKSKLNAKQVPYEEITSVSDMLELGITQVPVLGIDGQLLEFAEANKWLNQQ